MAASTLASARLRALNHLLVCIPGFLCTLATRSLQTGAALHLAHLMGKSRAHLPIQLRYLNHSRSVCLVSVLSPWPRSAAADHRARTRAGAVKALPGTGNLST